MSNQCRHISATSPAALLRTIALALLLAVLIVDVGCSGDTDRFAGVWDLQQSESPDEGANLSREDVATMRELGLATFLNIDEDGSLTLIGFDRAIYGSWKATGNSSANATIDGQSADISLENDTLKLTQGEIELTFTRGDEESRAEADARISAGDGAEERQSSEKPESERENAANEAGLSETMVRGSLLEKPIELASTDTFRLVIDGTGVDKWGDPGYNLQIENKTSAPLDVWIKDPFTVQDKSVRAYLFETVPGESSATAFIQIDTNDLGATSTSALEKVKGTLLIDNDQGITIARCPVSL